MKQILIATDQLANALFGGWADETLSSRAWIRMTHLETCRLRLRPIQKGTT